jgi:hypothetical protein
MQSYDPIIIFLKGFKESPVGITPSHMALLCPRDLLSAQENLCLVLTLLIFCLSSLSEEIDYDHHYSKGNEPDNGIPKLVARFYN